MIDNLKIGQEYTRPELAKIWGYKGYQAFGKGVFTPKGDNKIFLFVTKKKQESLIQYQDIYEDGILQMEGEAGHQHDERLRGSSETNDSVYLFYREIHHTPFTFFGRVFLTDYIINFGSRRSHFTFQSEFALEPAPEKNQLGGVKEDTATQLEKEFEKIEKLPISSTEKEQLFKSRIGHSKFKRDLSILDTKCRLCRLGDTRLLIASHIKPWSRCETGAERIDPYNGLLLCPNHDSLFDKGLISFSDSGDIIISPSIDSMTWNLLNLRKEMKIAIHTRQIKYIRWHREENMGKLGL